MPDKMNKLAIAGVIEHAALTVDVTEKTVDSTCQIVSASDVYGLVVSPVWVARAAENLKDSATKVITVVSFPLGQSRTDSKVDQAMRAVADGAAEIDMVANIGWLLNGEYEKVEREIGRIRKAIPNQTVLKVIIEAGKLDDGQLRAAVKAVINGGAQYVKTSTGFSGGATIEQVRKLAKLADNQIKVKASGGIKTLAQLKEMLSAGADKIGTSSTSSILQEM